MKQNEKERIVKLDPQDTIDYLTQPLKNEYHASTDENVLTSQIETKLYNINWQIRNFKERANELVLNMIECQEWCEQLVRIRFENADLIKGLMDRQNKFEHIYNEFARSLKSVDRLKKLEKDIDQMLINETPQSGDLVGLFIDDGNFELMEIGVYIKHTPHGGEPYQAILINDIEYCFDDWSEDQYRIVVLEKKFDDLTEWFYKKVIHGNS